MIIACDLDRTLLPNGEWPNNGSLPIFYQKLEEVANAKLIYVSGRNFKLYKEAVDEFGIKTPDYFIGAVGTEIFKNKEGELLPDENWFLYLQETCPQWERDEIISDLQKIDSDLVMQEDFVQNDYKISYYLDFSESKIQEILNKIRIYFQDKDLSCEIIYSHDPLKKVGLLDLLPKVATKLGALNFLVQKLDKKKNEVFYAGDSGNDLLAVTGGFNSILVRNTPDNIKNQAKEMVTKKGLEKTLYIADGKLDNNGYYASGVIEGLVHFGVFGV